MKVSRSDLAKLLIVLGGLACLAPAVSSGVALVTGVFLALVVGNPWQSRLKPWTSRLLSVSVVGLGAGMNLITVAHVGIQGLASTVGSLATVFGLGWALQRWLKTPRDTSILVTVGTAICGGSAIAAVAPVLRARAHEISVSLGIVFLLNAVSLFIFPGIGHALNLSEHQFGLWCALAIHDTSSVVGAAMSYGPDALQVATTTKLARSLWIVPVTVVIGAFIKPESARASEGRAEVAVEREDPFPKVKTKRPWFILGFLIVAAVVTFVPELQPAGHVVESIARRTLVLTLFLIGLGLTRETVRSVGARPFVQGALLWVATASLWLAGVKMLA